MAGLREVVIIHDQSTPVLLSRRTMKMRCTWLNW